MPKADDTDSKIKQKEYDPIAFANFILTFFGIIVVIAYTSVTGWLASLTNQSVSIAQKQFELSERAWLIPTPKTILQPLQYSKPLVVRIEMSNSGHSVASVVWSHAVIKKRTLEPNFGCSPSGDWDTFRCGNGTQPCFEQDRGPLVAPNQLTNFDVASEALSDADVDRINQGNRVKDPVGLFLQGCVSYCDGLRQPHVTVYCAVYIPDLDDPARSIFVLSRNGNYAN